LPAGLPVCRQTACRAGMPAESIITAKMRLKPFNLERLFSPGLLQSDGYAKSRGNFINL